jgi:hypothetical protein
MCIGEPEIKERKKRSGHLREPTSFPATNHRTHHPRCEIRQGHERQSREIQKVSTTH